MTHTRHERHERETEGFTHATTHSTPDAQHEQLDAFVGKWHMQGQQLAGPAGPAAPITALETYEWLPGAQFLIHRLDGRIGDSQAACIEIIGFDAERRCYRAHTFYNNGQMNVWDIERRDDAWRVLGDWSAGGRSMKVRCMIRFAENDTMHSRWEHSSDGSTWHAFWEVTARRVTDH